MRALTFVGVIALAMPLIQSTSFRPRQGFVPDKETAISVGRALLSAAYGKEQISSEEPLYARLSGKVWIVKGSIPPLKPGEAYIGGLAEVRISKQTGAVTYMTHGK